LRDLRVCALQHAKSRGSLVAGSVSNQRYVAHSTALSSPLVDCLEDRCNTLPSADTHGYQSVATADAAQFMECFYGDSVYRGLVGPISVAPGTGAHYDLHRPRVFSARNCLPRRRNCYDLRYSNPRVRFRLWRPTTLSGTSSGNHSELGDRTLAPWHLYLRNLLRHNGWSAHARRPG